MENKSTQCRNCKYLDRYYTMEIKTFRKTNLGWCCNKKETVSVTDSCKQHVRKTQRKVKRTGIQRYLDNILTQLSSMRYVLEEEINESDEMQKLQ